MLSPDFPVYAEGASAFPEFAFRLSRCREELSQAEASALLSCLRDALTAPDLSSGLGIAQKGNLLMARSIGSSHVRRALCSSGSVDEEIFEVVTHGSLAFSQPKSSPSLST